MPANEGSKVQHNSQTYLYHLYLFQIYRVNICKFFKSMCFPSITGLEANAPIFPSPKTAEPLEITATNYLLRCNHMIKMVYFEFLHMGLQHQRDARDKSLWDLRDLVGLSQFYLVYRFMVFNGFVSSGKFIFHSTFTLDFFYLCFNISNLN